VGLNPFRVSTNRDGIVLQAPGCQRFESHPVVRAHQGPRKYGLADEAGQHVGGPLRYDLKAQVPGENTAVMASLHASWAFFAPDALAHSVLRFFARDLPTIRLGFSPLKAIALSGRISTAPTTGVLWWTVFSPHSG
jgi:hypothetical protein